MATQPATPHDSRRRPSSRIAPIGGYDADVNHCGECDAFINVDLILAPIASGDQGRCGLHAGRLHRAFLFVGHRTDLLFNILGSVCQNSVAQPFTIRAGAVVFLPPATAKRIGTLA